MLPGCCPSCGYTGEIEGFLIEPEAKRVIARVAALEPAIGKVLGPYLRLFGSGPRGVQLRRAVKLIDGLTALVESGSVCRDERAGVRRTATPAMWAAGIEQMLAAPPSGPLQNHHYLRAVVFGIADSADAQAERATEEQRRSGHHRSGPTRAPEEDRLTNAIRYADQMLAVDRWTREQRDAYVAEQRAKLAGTPS